MFIFFISVILWWFGYLSFAGGDAGVADIRLIGYFDMSRVNVSLLYCLLNLETLHRGRGIITWLNGYFV